MPLAIRTILGACILLGRIPIGNWLTALLGIASLAVLFRWKVNVPLLMPRRQRWVSSPTQCCNFEPRAMTGFGPKLPARASQEVVSHLRDSCRDANIFRGNTYEEFRTIVVPSAQQ
jgi:hypothetical protein